jgi:hypothetical protein
MIAVAAARHRFPSTKASGQIGRPTNQTRPLADVERLQRLLVVLGSPGKLRGIINKVRSVSLPEIRPPFDLDRRRPELVFALLIAFPFRLIPLATLRLTYYKNR